MGRIASDGAEITRLCFLLRWTDEERGSQTMGEMDLHILFPRCNPGTRAPGKYEVRYEDAPPYQALFARTPQNRS